MWGWLSSLVDGITAVWQGITSLPSKIAEAISGFFQNIVDAIVSLGELIGQFFVDLGNTVLNGIKDIFIPDTEELKAIWNDTTERISAKFGFATYEFEKLFTDERAIDDVTADYNINGLGTLNIPILENKYLIDGITYFRPYIRGFIVLLCVFYNIRMAVGFFGYSSGEVKSASKGEE